MLTLLKRSLRLLITLKCNMNCYYCCNNLKDIRDKFEEKNLKEINFNRFDNICITGGEPLLSRDILAKVIMKIPCNKYIYLYTNGLLLQKPTLELLSRTIDGFNVGIHNVQQLQNLPEGLFHHKKVRFSIEDKNYEKFINLRPSLKNCNIKTWKRNKCYNFNEVIYLLKSI